jgi:hypothetical protein
MKYGAQPYDRVGRAEPYYEVTTPNRLVRANQRPLRACPIVFLVIAAAWAASLIANHGAEDPRGDPEAQAGKP